MKGNKPSRPECFRHLRTKLEDWEIDERIIEAVLKRIVITAGSRRSEDIIRPGGQEKHGTVLLDGVACLYEQERDGSRQILDFQYSGDFCDLNRHVLPTSNGVGVAAITDCSVGIFNHREFDELIRQYPSLGLAVWRGAMLEASIFRQNLLNGRRPALERVAHLLCELLARRGAVGIHSSTIPFSQIDLADATGLSFVHVNRTFKELLKLNLLVKNGRGMTVADRKGLAALATFDGCYLNMPHLLSDWQVEFSLPGTLINRSKTIESGSGLIEKLP